MRSLGGFMDSHKKLFFLAGLFSMISVAGCDDSDSNNRMCDDTLLPKCMDNSIQLRCSEHGIAYYQICSQGCVTDDTGKSICKGENFCTTPCQAGEYCDYDTCVKGTRPVDPVTPTDKCTNCAANEVCVNGVCRLPGTCTTKADCSNNQECVSGICTDPQPQQTCVQTGCATGFVCNQSTGQCDPDTSSDCRTDGCDDGYQCNQTTGLCEEDYPPQTHCKDTGCKTGEVCDMESGVCVKEPECSDTKPCTEAGFTCESNHCVPSTKNCVSDGCPVKYNCNTETKLCEPVEENCIKDGCPSDSSYFCNTITKACEPLPDDIECGALTITDTTNTCEKTGSGKKVVLRGDVLGLEKTWKGGSVVVENGKITYVGCTPDMADATVITCPNAVISPSFINGHEHLTYSNGVPGTWGDERFDHRYDWRKGANGHKKVPGGQTGDNEVVELRAIMGGTTSIFGSGSVSGLTRNLDTQAINGIKSTYQTFPLGDSSKNYSTVSSCADYEYHKSVLNFKDDCPYGPHIAEGINQGALNELRCLNGEGIDGQGTGAKNIFTSHLAIIHGVAATPEIITTMAANNTKLIWSPRTNISLYGDTAQAPMFDTLGVTIGLGTDWIYSGSANMLREFACIDDLNTNYYGKYFSDYKLWKMPTYNNAVAFGVEGSIGQLKAGLLADIAIFKAYPNVRESYRAVIEAENKDVTLVMIGGNMMYGDANIMTTGDEADVCGVAKKVNVNGNGGSYSYSSIKSAAKYDLFFCDTPKNEPTCTPMRTRDKDTTDQQTTMYTGDFSAANDADGDGIADDVDNCPTIFNPIRPQYTDRKQADFDGDGLGDVCDPYPTCADNNASCPKFNADDRDNDGITNLKDNCPDIANPEQEDTDKDGIGDACDKCDDRYDTDGDGLPDNCDECPEDSNNEDGKGCSLKFTSVYDIRSSFVDETFAEGLVKTKGIVTAIAQKYDGSAKTGFFIQDPEKDAGLFVYGYEAAATVKPGDLVEVYGNLISYYSLVEIKSPTVTVVSSDHEVKPITLTAAQTTENTSDVNSSNKYDSMLVHVSGLTVTDYNKPEGNNNAGSKSYVCSDANGDTAYLDDYIMGTSAIEAAVEIGATYDVTGILVYDFGRSKIAPLNADALVAGLGVRTLTAPKDAAWGSEVEVTLTMTMAVEEATDVAITCDAGECPEKVTVAKDSNTASFNVKMPESGDMKITATYDDKNISTTISGTSNAPAAIASYDPEAISIQAGGSKTVTITFDKTVKTATTLSLSPCTEKITVPATVDVPAGSESVQFVVSASTELAPDTYTITATLGDNEPLDIPVSIIVISEYLETFDSLVSFAKTGYNNPQTIKRDDDIVVKNTSAIFKKSTNTTGSIFFGSDDNVILVMNGKCDANNQVVVSNLPNGIATVSFDARVWAKDSKAYIDILADNEVVKTGEVITEQAEAKEYTFTIDAPTAKSFTVRMSNNKEHCKSDNKPRLGLDNLKWTAGKK